MALAALIISIAAVAISFALYSVATRQADDQALTNRELRRAIPSARRVSGPIDPTQSLQRWSFVVTNVGQAPATELSLWLALADSPLDKVSNEWLIGSLAPGVNLNRSFSPGRDPREPEKRKPGTSWRTGKTETANTLNRPSRG